VGIHLNENVIPMAFFSAVFLLNLQYPIVGIVFIAAPLLIAVAKWVNSLIRGKGTCAECALYHHEMAICLYDDKCVERCEKFRPNIKGDK